MKTDLTKLCKKASEIIQSYSKGNRIRVVSHYDADGTTAAAIICLALRREGYDFHATLMRNPFDRGLERVSKENNDLIIFTDMGSGQIGTLEQFKCKMIIIDHHQCIKEKTSENVLQINANLCGINGNYEACGSTLAYSLAKTLNLKNVDLSPLAITGATGDKQYIGGIRGYNKDVLDEALQNVFLKEKVGIKLNGDTIYDALYFSTDPYYTELSGNKDEINNLLEKLKLEPDVKIQDLDEIQKKQLNSYLILKLIKNGCEKNILDTVIRKRYTSERTYCELESLADLLDSCGKGGNRSLGLMLCMGDKNAFEQAKKLEKEYKQKILDELFILEKNGVTEKKSFRYFYSKNSSLGGVIGGIATNFILDKKKPLISLVRNDDELHVSCRGNQHLVANGLDLGLAMKKAAEQLGGHGGGHAIASGATIDLNKEKQFLDLVDDIIFKQLTG